MSKSRFTCEIPIGLHHVRIRAQGFVSLYLWDQEVRLDDAARIGTYVLRPGASVVGWVETAARGPAGAVTRIELEPLHAEGTSAVPAGEIRKRASLVLAQATDDRGFFHFEGVPPGDYRLRASRPGFATTERAPVRVVARAETRLDQPVLLAPPANQEVFLDPAIAPSGNGWHLRLEKMDPFSGLRRLEAEATVPPDGWWRFEGLDPGTYALSVSDGELETFLERDVEVDFDGAPLFLELGALRVRGTVVFGKKRLPSYLRFQLRARGAYVAIDTDEDGEFEGTLPEPGEWSVFVRGLELPLKRHLKGVVIYPPEDGGDVELTLRLPGTRVTGETVDELGLPVAQASVTGLFLERGERPVVVRSNDEGQFELLGVPEGPLRFQAEASDGRTSEWVAVNVEEGLEPPSARLVVKERLRLRGEVVSANGPVPGAAVTVLPAHDPFQLYDIVTTDVRGWFEASLPSGTSSALVTVGAPGYALRSFRAEIRRDQPLTIPVDQVAGTLVVDLPEPLILGDLGTPVLFLTHGSSAIDPGMALPWMRQHGGGNPQGKERVVLPRMEPGDYAACWGSLGELAGPARGAPDPHYCASGYLAPDGELHLAPPGGSRVLHREADPNLQRR